MARNPRRGAYRAAQLAARRGATTLSRQAIENMLRVLRSYADTVSRATAAGAQSRQLFLQAATSLERALQTAVRAGREVSYAEAAKIWERASLATLRAEGLTTQSLISAVRDPPVTLLGAYERLGGAAGTWRTAISTMTARLSFVVDEVVTTGIAAGVSPVELARRLRPYVVGSEPFARAFGGIEGVDLRRSLPPYLREAARQLIHNSQRIAFTEIHNARAEAEITAFAADPFVEAIAWRLAPDRGSQTTPDECDILAAADEYGLGDGVYPVDAVPVPPHPWDRCERVPITRDTERVNDPRPSGVGHVVRGDDLTVPRGGLVSREEASGIRDRAARLMEQGAAASVGF